MDYQIHPMNRAAISILTITWSLFVVSWCLDHHDIVKITGGGSTVPSIEIRKTLERCGPGKQDTSSAGPEGLPRELQECGKKITVSLRLINKGVTERGEQFVTINSVTDLETGAEAHLYHPLVIQLKQEQVSLAYPFKYLQSVNNKPYEEILSHARTHNFTGCVDQAEAHDLCASLALGPSHRGGPTGFCCSCLEKSLKGHPRYQTQCKDHFTDQDSPGLYSSAHCLRFHPLWYSVHMFGEPYLHHALQLKVYIEGHKALSRAATYSRSKKKQWWKLTEHDLMLSFERAWNSSSNKMVLANYRIEDNSFSGQPLDHERQRLLIPEPVVSGVRPEQLKGNAWSYMVVDKSRIADDGTSCNKIGVSYPAFIGQDDRCKLPIGSCLDHQPFDLWLADEKRRLSKQKTHYRLPDQGLLSSPPIIHSSLSGVDMVHFVYEDSYQGLLDIEINADSMLFFTPGSLTEILEVSISPDRNRHWLRKTTPHVSTDQIVSQLTDRLNARILLRNFGIFAAKYSVRLADCTPNVGQTIIAEVKVDPQFSSEVEFQLHLSKQNEDDKNKNHTCRVEVLTSGRVVALRDIWFLRGGRCYCVNHCLCTCDIVSKRLCMPMTVEQYSKAGLDFRPLKDWKISPHIGISNTWKIVLIVLGSLLLAGILKAIIGLTISRFVGLFGFAGSGRTDEITTCFEVMTNIFFFYLTPILFLYWICRKVIDMNKVDPTQRVPLLPSRKWSDIMDEDQTEIQNLPGTPKILVTHHKSSESINNAEDIEHIKSSPVPTSSPKKIIRVTTLPGNTGSVQEPPKDVQSTPVKNSPRTSTPGRSPRISAVDQPSVSTNPDFSSDSPGQKTPTKSRRKSPIYEES